MGRDKTDTLDDRTSIWILPLLASRVRPRVSRLDSFALVSRGWAIDFRTQSRGFEGIETGLLRLVVSCRVLDGPSMECRPRYVGKL